MSEKILSLSKLRKTRGKVRKRQQADENAAKFGQSKPQKAIAKTRAEQAEKRLSAHKRGY